MKANTKDFKLKYEIEYICLIWRPTSLSELTPMIFNVGLTHLRWEASILKLIHSTFIFDMHN